MKLLKTMLLTSTILMLNAAAASEIGDSARQVAPNVKATAKFTERLTLKKQILDQTKRRVFEFQNNINQGLLRLITHLNGNKENLNEGSENFEESLVSNLEILAELGSEIVKNFEQLEGSPEEADSLITSFIDKQPSSLPCDNSDYLDNICKITAKLIEQSNQHQEQQRLIESLTAKHESMKVQGEKRIGQIDELKEIITNILGDESLQYEDIKKGLLDELQQRAASNASSTMTRFASESLARAASRSPARQGTKHDDVNSPTSPHVPAAGLGEESSPPAKTPKKKDEKQSPSANGNSSRGGKGNNRGHRGGH